MYNDSNRITNEFNKCRSFVGVTPINQLRTCDRKTVAIQYKSPYVDIAFFHTTTTTLKEKNSLPFVALLQGALSFQSKF